MKTKEQIEAEKKYNHLAGLIQSSRVLAEIIKNLDDTPITDDLKDRRYKIIRDFIEKFLDLNETIYKNMFGEPKIKIQ